MLKDKEFLKSSKFCVKCIPLNIYIVTCLRNIVIVSSLVQSCLDGLVAMTLEMMYSLAVLYALYVLLFLIDRNVVVWTQLFEMHALVHVTLLDTWKTLLLHDLVPWPCDLPMTSRNIPNALDWPLTSDLERTSGCWCRLKTRSWATLLRILLSCNKHHKCLLPSYWCLCCVPVRLTPARVWSGSACPALPENKGAWIFAWSGQLELQCLSMQQSDFYIYIYYYDSWKFINHAFKLVI